MPKKNIVLLMSILIFILIVVLVLQSTASKSRDEQKEIPIQSQPTITIPPSQIVTSDFLMLGTSIKDNQLGVSEDFQIYFSNQVSHQDFNYSISPEVKLELSLDSAGKVLTINPEGIWSFETEYKITILKDTKSIKGQRLDTDIVVTFKTPPYSGI